MSGLQALRRHTLPSLLSAGVCLLLVACTSKDDWQDIGDCPVPLTNAEIKQRCNAAFNRCLETRIQGIESETWGHSLCPICMDVCLQQKWLGALRGRGAESRDGLLGLVKLGILQGLAGAKKER